MRTEISPGQTSDYLGYDMAITDNLPRPNVLLADRGFDADKTRDHLKARNLLPE